ncbi:BMP family ABC transporter substrate-binding protein [Lachnospiraceae bacterium]|jgi:basic membrane protein A|nr:BMP family ABC transporter substrate-binding protein [Lachnospiraceae bacterium]GFI15600.1 membrane lipoprotein TmpC [Lachnospiraceae bacterium]
MKKKIVAIILSMSMIMTSLMGCGKTSEETQTAQQNSESNEAGQEKEQDTEKEEAPSQEDVRIALLLSGNLGDMSFLDSANKGTSQIMADYGAQVKVIEMGSDATKYETNVLDASDEGYDIIIGSGWQLQEPFQNVAKDYPDIKYIIFDAAVDYAAGDYSNVYSISYKSNEAAYLAGIMAANMSKTSILGFLGGADGAVINDFMIGFIEGARSVDPDIKVICGYVDDYSDSPKCKEMALAQYNQGADIIFTAAGASGIGTLEAAKETGNYAIGVDSDQAMLYAESDPAQAQLIPASVMKNVDATLVRAYEMIQEGTLPWGQEEALGLSDGAVGLSDNEFYQKLVPEDVKVKIDEASDAIARGEISVKSAYGLTTEEVREIINSVAP